MKETSPRLFQPWDELNTLISSFGLYRSEKAAYDRSIINTLYNTNQIAGAGHPAEVIESVKHDNEGDGLFGRFLLSAPTPYLPLAEEISDINENCASLTHLLYIINLLNPTENEYGDPIRMVYKYEEAAESIMKGEKWNEYVLITRECFEYDGFLTSLYSKAKVQLHRIAGALHVARIASEVIAQWKDGLPYHDISKQRIADIQHVVDNYTSTTNYEGISVATAKKACLLTDYFITQKKIIGGRPAQETIQDLRQRFEDNDNALEMAIVAVRAQKSVPHIKILLAPGLK
ncbi:unnamed protein product, partial [Didymodactylos carnosus]